MKKALLVIDMQNFCVGSKHASFFRYDAKLVERVNFVIKNNEDSIIVYVRNIMKRNFRNKFIPFSAYAGTKNIELVDNLEVITDYIFDKYVGNAFTNTELIEFLKQHKVDTVEIVGVDGGGCVSMSAISAIENGFHVILNTNAIGTVYKRKKEKYFKKLDNMGATFI